MSSQPPPACLTPTEAAESKGLNLKWLYHHLRYLTCYRVRGQVRIYPDDLDRFLSTFPVLPVGALATTGDEK